MNSEIVILESLPIYIKLFLEEGIDGLLIHKKSTSKIVSECECQEDFNGSNINNATLVSVLDLTGNPWVVDLEASVLINEELKPTSVRKQQFAVGESQHLPFSLKEARDIIKAKTYLKSQKPVFCVVDGKNNQNAVIIGAHHKGKIITTYLAQLLDSNSFIIETFLEILEKEHKRSLRFKVNSTSYHVKRIFNIDGLNLQEVPSLESMKFRGCMFLETSWNTFSNEPPAVGTDLKLMLKVVLGHKESPISFLWDQTVYLQKLLDIWDNQTAFNDGNTVISDNYSTISDLINEIHFLYNTSNFMKKRDIVETLDFNNLREEIVLDKLWSCVSRCQNLTDLKNCLLTFFRIAKFEKSDSNERMSGFHEYIANSDYLLEPTYLKALKILTYIGFEKLKEDYFTILNFYYPDHQIRLKKKWDELKNYPMSKSMNHEVAEMKFNRKKISFLNRLHEASEILIYLKYVLDTHRPEMSSSNFGSVCKNVHEKYLFSELKEISDDELKVRLLEITCDLDSSNRELYENKIPETSIIEASTKSETWEVKTVIHISQKKLLPGSLYDDYDSVSSNSIDLDFSNLNYVTKMTILKSMN